MVDRVHFSMRFRHKEESVTQFINALRGLSGKCDFGVTLCERLRDQVVIGINNLTWQQELLRQFPSNAATLQQVEEAATRLELAQCQVVRLQSCTKISNDALVNRLRREGNDGSRRIVHRRRIDPSKHCLRCGGNVHSQNSRCPAEGKKCYQCGVTGHLAIVCVSADRAERSRQKQRSKVNTLQVMQVEEESDEPTDINVIMTSDVKCRKAVVTVIVDNRRLKMLYDPGAAYSVIDKTTWDWLGRPPLKEAADLLAYTNVPVRTLGKAEVTVNAFGKRRNVDVYVVNGNDSPLFGLDWCMAFELPFPKGIRILNVTARDSRKGENNPKWKALVDEFEDAFNRKRGAIIGYQATVHMQENAIPRAFKARPVPFALRKQVEDGIHRMLDEEILEPVDTSCEQVTWASAIVCVVKPSGKVRICGDFKVTINQYVIVNRHPLPTFEEMTAKLNGGTVFSVIDLKDAYLQMEVAPASRQYLVMVIATHLGFYRFKRLPFGISFAPALFQKTMEQILAGLGGVAVYIDDIIVSNSSYGEHLDRLRAVFLRLRQSGIRVHRDKCKFLQRSVNYLGHRIDANGIHPTEERIRAIKEMPEPTNVRELRSFLGAVNYYARFIPHLQSRCASLYELTKANVPWTWNQRCSKLYKELKNCLMSSDTLVHYDSDLPLVLSTDACERGLGAVLCHRFPSGMEKPIAFASRLLTDAEKRYANIDKEALAIMFGVSKFAQYLYGRHFTLKTDHKPLERIFGTNRELPKPATNRLMRWALILGNYQYAVEYVPASRNAPADALSRLPVEETDIPVDVQQPSGQLLNLRINELTLSKRQLQRCLAQDRVLGTVIRYIESGWPSPEEAIDDELRPFFDRRLELSYEDHVLMWQGRIVVPTALRLQIQEVLHESHPGIVAMKSMARFYIWWPGVDKDIAKMVNECLTCQSYQRNPPEVPLVGTYRFGVHVSV
uniref:RNA-directed DNA polymerase n=1 Tax=Trichuris muris TaxID=70415 RepID=A0A5S6QLW0_TRIMR